MSAQGSSQATKTRHHGLRGTGPKRGVLAAAVALCCVLGIGTAVAAGALTDEGTTAPSGSSEALQTASFDPITGTGNYGGSASYRSVVSQIAELEWEDLDHPEANSETGIFRTYDGTDSNVVCHIVGKPDDVDCEVIVENGTAANAGFHTAQAVGLEGADSDLYALPDYCYGPYYIEPCPITPEMFVVETEATYEEDTQIDPASLVTVTTDEEISPLPTDADYYVTCTDGNGNTVDQIEDAGTYTIIVTGTHNFKGEQEFTFVVDPADTEPTTIPGADGDLLTATYGDTLDTVDLSSYNDGGTWAWAVEDASATFVGDVGKNSFAATWTPDDPDYAPYTTDLTVEVAPLSIEDMTFTYDPTEMTYTGTALYPTISAPDDPVTGEPMIEGSDFTVTYYDETGAETTPIGVGTYTFTITGTGNFTGELPTTGETYTFTITQATPTEDIPTGLTATYGDTLDDVVLPRSSADPDSWGWAWDDPETSVGDVGEHTFPATYTPEDSSYAKDTEELTVTVLPKPVDFTWSETVRELTPDDQGSLGWTYDGQDVNVTAAFAEGSIINGDDVTITVEGGDTKDAGVHHATVSKIDDGNETCNYTFEDSLTADCYYYIEHATAVIDIVDATKTYGEGNPEFKYVLEDEQGLLEGEISIELARTDLETEGCENAGIHNGVIDATYELDESLASNYIITVRKGNLLIERADISEMQGWDLDEDSVIYDGQEHADRVTGVPTDPVTNEDMIEGTDYNVSYAHNTDAGTATFVITGTGNYTGIITDTFTIKPAEVTITCKDAEKDFGDPDPDEFTGTVEGLINEGDLGEVTYTRKPGENAGTYAIYPEYTENSNYTVTVVEGTFTINPKTTEGDTDLTFTLAEGPFIYNGNEITPTVTGNDGGTPLTEGVDFTVRYRDNTHAGTATVIVDCCGNYSGEVELTFTIEPAAVTITCVDASKTYGDPDPTLGGRVTGISAKDDLHVSYSRADGESVGTYDITATYDETNSDYTVTAVRGTFTINPKDEGSSDLSFTLDGDTFTYRGSAIEPTVTGMDGSTELTAEDFTVTYEDNTDAGTAKAIVEGTGNYSGTVELIFTIEPAGIDVTWTSNIDGAPNTFTRVYDGTALTVSASVADGLLGDDAGKGFEVTVEDASATDVGVYMATATGITLDGVANGNYVINSSTAYCAYSIDTAQLTLAQFTVDTDDKEYTGSEIEPPVTSDLVLGTDYTVSYSDNVDLGTATITITGQGNYGGKLTYHFDIVKYTPQVTTPGPFEATYGDKLGTLDLNGTMAEPGGSENNGSWAWTAGDEAYVGDAGPQTAEAVYTPADTTYANTVTAEITIEVSPISIAGMDPGFTWTDPDEVPYAGYILSADITPPTDPVTGRPLIEGTDYTVTYYVDNGDGTYGTDSVDPKDVGSYVFYIDGIGNYCDRFSDEGGTFTITMGNPDPIAPTGLTATYGETLGDVILPRSSGDANAWGWTWDNPEASVGNVGGNLFDATYTPQDPNTQATVHEQLTVDVSPKPVELAWTTTVHTEASYIDGAYDWVYDGRSANLQATIADRYLVGEDTCTVTEYKDNTEKDAGMHMATAVSLDNENYTLSATTASCYYYIEHASVTIEIADATKTYGEDDPTFNYTVEGLADGESLDITCSRTDGDDPEREDAGVHNGVIVASYEDPNNISDNYTIATKVGSLIIERATFDEETKDDYWTVDTYAENYDGTAKTKAISGTSQYGVELVEGTDYTVTYNHNVDAGTAVITVTGQGNYSFMLTWTFEILPVDVIITCGNAEKTYGDADPAMPTYTVTPEDAAASLGTVTCSREKGEDAGEYDITASYTASGNYSVSVVAGTFTINPKPLDEADFTIDEGPYTYTGTEIEPAVTGIDQTTSKLLAQGTDYTVEYSDKVAVGTGTVTITCTGNYSGEFTLYFEIVASAFGEAVFDVEVAGDTYDGQPHEVTVTPAAGSDLQPYDPATDDGDYSYTITDADGTDYGTGPVTNAGTYTVTITGHGNYEGSTYTYEFTIAPAVIGLSWEDAAHEAPCDNGLITFTYDGAAANICATATDLIDGDECTVEVSGGTEVNTGVHMATAVSLSNANYTLPGHAYCTYYIAPAQLTDEMFTVDTDEPYSDEGYAIDDLVAVAAGATPTPAASDYTVTCTNEAGDVVTTATEVGTYTITIQGKSNFTGKLTFSFQITKETPEPSVTVPKGAAFEATYGDTFGDIDLSTYNAGDTNGSWGWADSEAFVGAVDTHECELIYTPADTEHVATVTVGVTVTVGARSIATMQPTFTIENKTDTYTGYPIYGDITVPADPVTGEPMVEGTDYSVDYYKYDDETDTYGEEAVTPTGVGTYTFTITGTGNYTDTLNEEHTYTLTIGKAEPSKEFPPENLTATYGDKLEDIILPRSSDDPDDSWGWAWDEDYFGSEDLDDEHYFTSSGPHTYYAKFTPEDDDDYETYDEPLSVWVQPKAVELAWSDEEHYPEATGATGFSRVYDGEASNLTATVTEDSLVHNDTDITVTAYEEGSNTAADAGVHTATATTLSNGNYTLEGSSSATCSYYIERAPVTVIPDNFTKEYGATDPELTGEIVGDVADGDSIGTVTYTREPGEDVGTYTITATVEGANPNYQIACETGTFTITPVDFGGTLTDTLTFTLEDGPFTYNGSGIEPQVSVTDAEGNAVDTDEFTITYVNNVNAGTATVVIVGNGNYEGIYTTTFTIDKATPDVTAPEGLTATYGDTLGSLTLTDGWTFDEGDAVAVGNIGEQTHAATYTPADTANYNTVSADVTVNVSPKQITEAMFTVDTANVEYTGYDITKSVLGVDGASVMVRGTDYTTTYTLEGGQPAASAHEPGTYTITIEGTGNYTGDLTYTFEVTKPIPAYTTPADLTAVYGDTLASVTLPEGWAWDDATASVGEVGSNAFAATYTPDDDNYATVTEELSVTVTPKPIALTWNGEALVTYDGTEHEVTASVSASDLVGSDSCEVSVTGGSAKDAGAYTATATLDNANYTPTNDTFAYTIEHRTIVVYADDASKTHGAALSSVTLTGGYSNLADADSGTFSVTGFTVPDWSADTEQVGETYAIVPTYAWSDEGVAANYDVQVVDGELKIVDYEIPSDLTGTYGDTLASITLPSGWTWADATTQILADAGSTAVYPALFNGETNNLTVTVGARTVTLSWSDSVSADGTGDRTYDGKVSAVGATAGNLVGSDTCTVTVEGGDAVDAGTYTARAVALSNANYALPADATYVYHIERASAVIAVDDATKVKGAADPKLTGHVDGLIAEGDLGEIVYSREEGEAVGSYQITATYTANANYTVTVEPGTFTITAKQTTKDDSLHVGDTFWYHDGQYTVTSTTTARYNWPRATTTKANVATTIHRGGLTLNVTKIKKTAFKNRTKLTVIKIGDHVKKIPKKEFKGCKNVTKIVLGKDVKTIGKASAKGLKKLKKVNVKSTKLKKIAAKAFQNDKKLKTVKIKSKKLKTIGKLAFAGCKKLKKMNLKSKKLKKIGAKAFKSDKKLKKFVAKSPKLKKIGKKCFKGCKKLKALTLKSTKLKAKGVKKALKGSKVKVIKTSTSTKKTRALNKKLKKLYKKDFKKKNSGRKVAVR